jgi:hypothetical protein
MTKTAFAKLRLGMRSGLGSRRALDCGLALLILFGTHAVYASARGVVQLCDSTYSLVAAETLLKDGTLDLKHRLPPDLSRLPGYNPGSGLPYHLVRVEDSDRIHYGYPLGSTILSLPWVGYYTVFKDRSTLDAAGFPNYSAEGLIQVKIAARVTAAIAVLFFVLARLYVSPLTAALLACGFAFGSPLYSTMARALWSHTWMAFWLTAAIVLLVGLRRRVNPSRWSDVLFGMGMGTAFFWATFARQHAVLSAAAIGLYLLLHHRRVLAVTVMSGGLWTAGLVAFSLGVFGTIQPPSVYGASMMDGEDLASRFAWLMVSPTRGLLVYCPYVLVSVLLLIGGRKHLTDAGLLLPAGLAIAAHTLMIASFKGWHANSAYGPRYFCDVMPWFALLAAMSAAAIPALPRFRWCAALALTISFAWGVFVHERGANVIEAWMWNELPKTAGNEGSVQDWKHPQFLAGITFSVNPDGTILEY